jgi:cytochrome c peroxidase
VGSEFEVLGVPSDAHFKQLSDDKGRYVVNQAEETFMAFRTGTVRNAEFTKPYMHNGIFNTLEEVVDFYDAGGGAGRNLAVKNQTLASDSLKLSQTEKRELILFIKALNEQVIFQDPPVELPASSHKEWNARKPGGIY